MEVLKFKLVGLDLLLQNNPQMSDPLNSYTKMMKIETAKRKKTDDDIYRMREIELEAKQYFDEDIGIYIPSSWIIASIGGVSWAQAKIKKADIRASVFMDEEKFKLYYEDMENVQTKLDVVKNPVFHRIASLKQGQVRVVKATPQFKNWSTTIELTFNPEIIPKKELQRLIEYAAQFGGYGDFRPTYGRANVEWIEND